MNIAAARHSLMAAWLTFGALLGNTLRADAGAPPVSLGEVRVDDSDASLERTFRNMVERELGKLDFDSARAEERFVLSAALATTTRKRSGKAESVAVVNATLRRARGGALHAVIQGRAQVADQPKDPRELQLTAMRAAVRNALRRVPEAIK